MNRGDYSPAEICFLVAEKLDNSFSEAKNKLAGFGYLSNFKMIIKLSTFDVCSLSISFSIFLGSNSPKKGPVRVVH